MQWLLLLHVAPRMSLAHCVHPHSHRDETLNRVTRKRNCAAHLTRPTVSVALARLSAAVVWQPLGNRWPHECRVRKCARKRPTQLWQRVVVNRPAHCSSNDAVRLTAHNRMFGGGRVSNMTWREINVGWNSNHHGGSDSPNTRAMRWPLPLHITHGSRWHTVCSRRGAFAQFLDLCKIRKTCESAVLSPNILRQRRVAQTSLARDAVHSFSTPPAFRPLKHLNCPSQCIA